MPQGQHATGWGSDAPTPAQMKEFFAQIDSERMTQTRLQMLLNNQPMPETVHISGEYQMTVHEGPAAIQRHLVEGKYVQRDYYGVNDANYPQGIITTSRVVPVRLLYFGRYISNAEALREFDKFGFEAAGPTAALGFAKRYLQVLQNQCGRIAALGQFHVGDTGPSDKRQVNLAVCVQLEAGRPEAWAWDEDMWKKHDTEVRFAVVAKKQ